MKNGARTQIQSLIEAEPSGHASIRPVPYSELTTDHWMSHSSDHP
jgi:hypothetical protein